MDGLEEGMISVVAYSGGKDSTALALRLRELHPGRRFVYLFTPTGDELPPMLDHWRNMECLLGEKLTTPEGPSLADTVNQFNAIPSWRMRFCTRLVKIQPVLAWVAAQTEEVEMFVGLRADEEERKGILGDVRVSFPMREWGWGLTEVRKYLDKSGVKIPPRTDCARCMFQRLGEWYALWREYPDIWADIEAQEARISEFRDKPCSWRSPTKDGWPGLLKDLRAEFEAGRRPRNATADQVEMFGRPGMCRVCSL
jgi:3'-phosphoadenosine 5'-phosphosulfate sulfotransferase (PAPS reductase)/FAD synthetase